MYTLEASRSEVIQTKAPAIAEPTPARIEAAIITTESIMMLLNFLRLLFYIKSVYDWFCLICVW